MRNCGLTLWRCKKSGTTTLGGNSNSRPSFAETPGAGFIHERKLCHEKIMRPRFSAGSTKFIGNATDAFIRFNCLNSVLNCSGHFSDKSASGAETVVESKMAGAIESAGATGVAIGAGAGGIGAGAIGLAGVGGATGAAGTSCRGGAGATGVAGAATGRVNAGAGCATIRA